MWTPIWCFAGTSVDYLMSGQTNGRSEPGGPHARNLRIEQRNDSQSEITMRYAQIGSVIMARKQLPPGTRWQRCRPDCGCDTQNPSRYDKCSCKSGCLRGSADRRIRDDYALMVNQMMMGGLAPNGHLWCPITGHPFHWVNGHVDKIGSLYLPGKIVLVSAEGNLQRSILQTRGEDMPGIDRYIADIAAASSRVNARRDGEITRRPGRRQTASNTVSGIDALMSGPYGTR